MNFTKRTYSIPLGIVKRFEAEVPTGNRSSVIGELLDKWLEERERERLRREVIEGCREMAEEYRATEREYHLLEEEVHRALEP